MHNVFQYQVQRSKIGLFNQLSIQLDLIHLYEESYLHSTNSDKAPLNAELASRNATRCLVEPVS